MHTLKMLLYLAFCVGWCIDMFMVTLYHNPFQDVLTLQFNGKNLDKKDFFGKSDPFLMFYRCNEDNR